MPEIEGKRRRPGFSKERRVTKDEILELLKNTFIMLAITVIAGGILGFVYEQTKAPIAAMELRTRQNACRKVFYSASDFSDSVISEFTLADNFKELYPGVDITDCIRAFDENNQFAGYVIEVVTHEGYGGDIDFYVGISNDGTVNGISFISISETAGLGMRADEVLTPQFRNRLADHFEVTKNGAVKENDIDAISSATITSKAVVGGVNAALEYFFNTLNGGDGE
ncbi:MAG: RnfABCDGE type electron transport complex subunit G [Lachnospiraceae bacterium]|nr:RnfABCDGE type electron transport complex subunit G [Lachnospiraceae bacterium]